MSFRTPTSKVSVQIDDLGKLDGFKSSNGVEQFCGIPYATLPQRWTRSTLRTTWENHHHDGTQLGSVSYYHTLTGNVQTFNAISNRNMCPRPQVGGDDASPQNPFIPVPPNPNFTRKPTTDEKSALVMNIVIPHHPAKDKKKCPVLAWIHGGSLAYGSANYGIYDAVNLVSHSVSIGLPIVAVNFNYRLGPGGFLASARIAEELNKDGFEGNGNFGFTDQKVAMDWVQKYIVQLGGDPDNVTVAGQSAGGVSIGHHLAARDPMKFYRAICMSGLGSTLPALSAEDHELIFRARCRYFAIDADAPDVLEQLRKLDEQALANADHIIQGVASGNGNPYPCFDDWFYARDPRMMVEAPDSVTSLLFGDVGDEGVIFVANVLHDTYETVKTTLQEHTLDEKFVDAVLEQYQIETEVEDEAVRRYSRFKTLLKLGSRDGLWGKFLTGMDYLVMKRGNVGKF